jgi:hypothetical protein
MFNKIAVVIRGHVRTWHYIKHLVFDNFSNIANSVDYYFVTWYLPELNADKIINSFAGKKLVRFVSVTPTCDSLYYQGGRGPSYLASHVLEPIMAGDYDAVIDTRPDVLPVLSREFNPKIGVKTVLVAWQTPSGVPNKHKSMDDMFQIMSKDTFALFCKKHTIDILLAESWHTVLSMFYAANNVTVKTLDCNEGFSGCHLIRPTIADRILNWDCITEDRKTQLLIDKSDWKNLSQMEKYALSEKYSILWQDYEWNKT